ncbi:Asp23/Gls24 family envelope stress response protein [Enterococcus sp. BWB1-3]|uniref:Asp23/Gls24 family envelope stress response protein n=1 Tax=unclassified Enterococcus TaxID=2608891 RepID=UPI00192451C3|nr:MULTISPECIES: Asp23/Gls24 family envelope stress response protein [unclassified Enterococcus]MBL1227846.1 Asp23/Gls24 family envelope stress response protein [Enterococcus sp. BWB1-3]MCB5953154.1 Asp23/Gls24 family envelope stress response protein [Enterococcus sp. BWT-B8]MCB5956182.1 Asp23/Gls24 family envelope stress response protein [Enterococcus sp. CWB-B31]
MAEERNLIIDTKDALGEIVIAPEVIEVIIGIAASKIDGVYGMRGTFANNVTEFLGRAAHGKGVYLNQEEDGLKVDIYCYLEYGVSVPKAALEMQERVKQQVLFMTDIDLIEVNIHVVAVIPEKLPEPDFSELFPEDGEENE